MTDATPPPLRTAIIGTGGIAHAHAQAVADLAPRIALAAVVDLDADRAGEFAERFGAAAVYPDADALLASEQLDLVHICTPPQTHVPLAIAALRAGVPALIEKPTALSLAEMDELVAVSRETGVPALTVYQHRFGAGAQRLMRLVADGALGRPLVATCETLWHRGPGYFDLPWRGRWEIEGGGPTMGHGIHQFDLLLAVLGPWSRLTAFAARQQLPTDTEDVSMALVEFDNGALATVVNSIVSPRETSRLRFDFAHATVELEHLYGYTDADWTFTPAPGHEHLAELWESEPEGGASVVAGAWSDEGAVCHEPGLFTRPENPRQNRGGAESALEEVEFVLAGDRRPVRGPRGVRPIGRQLLEHRSELGLVDGAEPAQAPGQPVMGECDGSDTCGVLRFGVAQPAQLGRRERRDGHNTQSRRVHISTHLGDQVAGGTSTAGVVPEQCVADDPAVLVEDDHAVLLPCHRDGSDIIESASLRKSRLQSVPPGGGRHLRSRRMRRAA